MLARWSSRELSELQGFFLLEQYEAQGLNVFDKDGEMKSLEALQEESTLKELQDRAEAGLK